MSETLQPLLDKLERAKFTGRLIVDFHQGQVRAARLSHYLGWDEFSRSLPSVENEPEAEPKCSVSNGF